MSASFARSWRSMRLCPPFGLDEQRQSLGAAPLGHIGELPLQALRLGPRQPLPRHRREDGAAPAPSRHPPGAGVPSSRFPRSFSLCEPEEAAIREAHAPSWICPASKQVLASFIRIVSVDHARRLRSPLARNAGSLRPHLPLRRPAHRRARLWLAAVSARLQSVAGERAPRARDRAPSPPPALTARTSRRPVRSRKDLEEEISKAPGDRRGRRSPSATSSCARRARNAPRRRSGSGRRGDERHRRLPGRQISARASPSPSLRRCRSRSRPGPRGIIHQKRRMPGNAARVVSQ